MKLHPELRTTLWRALRPMILGWGAVVAMVALLNAGLLWLHEQQAKHLQQLQSQRQALANEIEQIRHDRDLAIARRDDYVNWLRDGLISAEPVASWRALQMQKIMDWLGAQSPWVQHGMQIELQAAQPWMEGAASSPPVLEAPVGAGAEGVGSVQTLRVSATGLHDLEAWGVVLGIQRLLASAAALEQCAFKVNLADDSSSGEGADRQAQVPRLEWECEWSLFHLSLPAPPSME